MKVTSLIIELERRFGLFRELCHAYDLKPDKYRAEIYVMTPLCTNPEGVSGI